MTLHGVDWVAVLGGTAVGATILACCVAFGGDTPPLTSARLGLVALAAAAAFVLDEPAAAAVDATPTTLRRRTEIRLGAVTVPWSAWTIGVLALHGRDGTTSTGHLLLEGAGTLAVTVGLAATMRRLGSSEPGEVVATVVGGTMLGILLFGPGWRVVPLFPSSQDVVASSTPWYLLAGAAAALVAAATRDPGRRRGRVR